MSRASQSLTDLFDEFDPEGSGYDTETARRFGIQPDETGHMPSRAPNGQLLKGRKHPTFHKTVAGETGAGFQITKGEDGKYYSQKSEAADNSAFASTPPSSLTSLFEDFSTPPANDPQTFEPGPVIKRDIPGRVAAETAASALRSTPETTLPPAPLPLRGPDMLVRSLTRGFFDVQGSTGKAAQFAGAVLGDDQIKKVGAAIEAGARKGTLSVPKRRGSFVQEFAADVAQAAPQMVNQLALSGVGAAAGGRAGQIAGFIAGGVMPVVGNQFTEARDAYLADGVPPEQAEKKAEVEALTAGIITAATNAIPGVALFSKWVPGFGGALQKAAGQRAGQIIGRGISGMTGEAVQEGTEKVAIDAVASTPAFRDDPETIEKILSVLPGGKPVSDYWSEVLREAAIGGVLGGGAGVAVEATRPVPPEVMPPEEVQRRLDEIEGVETQPEVPPQIAEGDFTIEPEEEAEAQVEPTPETITIQPRAARGVGVAAERVLGQIFDDMRGPDFVVAGDKGLIEIQMEKDLSTSDEGLIGVLDIARTILREWDDIRNWTPDEIRNLVDAVGWSVFDEFGGALAGTKIEFTGENSGRIFQQLDPDELAELDQAIAKVRGAVEASTGISVEGFPEIDRAIREASEGYNARSRRAIDAEPAPPAEAPPTEPQKPPSPTSKERTRLMRMKKAELAEELGVPPDIAENVTKKQMIDAMGTPPETLLDEEGMLDEVAKRRFNKPFSELNEVQQSTIRLAQKVIGGASKAEQAAVDRLKARGIRLKSGIDPAEIADYVIIGAAKIVKGTANFAEWSTAMVSQFGESIRPRLQQIWELAESTAKWWEEEGPKKIGRPELANPATTEQARAVIDVIDETRRLAGQPEVKPDEQTEAEAQAIIRNEPNFSQRLLATAERGGQLSDAETRAGKVIVDRTAQHAIENIDNDQAVKDAVRLGQAWRETGTTQARAFRQRRDDLKTPAQRRRDYANEKILEPSEKDAKAMERLSKKQDSLQNRIQRAKSDQEKKRLGKELTNVTLRRERVLERVVDDSQKIGKALERIGISPSQLTDEQMDTPKYSATIAKVADTVHASKFDWFREWYINAIVSGPQTNIANITGNAFFGLWETLIQRFIEASVNLAVNDPDSAQFGEFRAMSRHVGAAFSRSATNFMLAWRTEQPVFEDEVGTKTKEVEGTKIEKTERKKAIPGVAGRVVRVGFGGGGTTGLVAFDELFKGFFGTLHAAAVAYRTAKANGLKGEAVNDYVDRVMSNPNDPAWDDAIVESERLAFQTPVGPIGEEVLRLRKRLPPLIFVIPFVTTPVNIFKQGLSKTPLVSIPTLYRMANQGAISLGVAPDNGVVYTKHQLNRDLANNIVAWGAFFALYGLLAEDDEGTPLITGSTAWNNGERGLAYRTAPPQSIKIKGRWYSYARIEPAAVSLSSIIDSLQQVKEMRKGKDWNVALQDAFNSLKRGVSDKTFLRGISDIMKILTEDDERTLLRMAQTFATSITIPNIVKQAARGTDDYIREQRLWGEGAEFWGRLAARTFYQAFPFPGLAPQPKVDLWGRDVRRFPEDGIGSNLAWRIVSPMRVKDDEINEVDRLIVNWNNENPNDRFAPREPRPYITIAGEQFAMTDQEFYDFKVEAGTIAAESLTQYIREGPLNADKPTKDDIDFIKTVISLSRDTARDNAIRKILDRQDEATLERLEQTQ